MHRILTALALSAALAAAIVAPAAAQGQGPKPHVPHCDWDPVALEWTYSNPSVQGFARGHVRNHLVMVLLPPGASPLACDAPPPAPVPPPV